MKVKRIFQLKKTPLSFLQGKLKEIVCQDIQKYVHKDEQLPVLLDR
jgi:hypothetical protein